MEENKLEEQQKQLDIPVVISNYIQQIALKHKVKVGDIYISTCSDLSTLWLCVYNHDAPHTFTTLEEIELIDCNTGLNNYENE